MSKKVYEIVATELLEMMKNSKGNTDMPWRAVNLFAQHKNIARNSSYRGINNLFLSVHMMVNNFDYPLWATGKWWLSKGFTIEKGTPRANVLFVQKKLYNTKTKKFLNFDGVSESAREKGLEDGTYTIRFVTRYYSLYNVEAIEGGIAYLSEIPNVNTVETIHDYSIKPIDEIEAFFRMIGTTIKENPNSAYLNTKDGAVYIPAITQFKSPQMYYSVLSHEHVHWTGMKNRLARKSLLEYNNGKRIRALEELIAEIGASLLCNQFGIENDDTRDDHADYCKSWYKVFKDEPEELISAVRFAYKAVEYINQVVQDNEVTEIADAA